MAEIAPPIDPEARRRMLSAVPTVTYHARPEDLDDVVFDRPTEDDGES